MTNLPFNPEDLPTPEEMKEIEAAIETVKFYVKEIRSQVLEDNTNFLAAGGTTEEYANLYQKKQLARVQELTQVQAVIQEFAQRVSDTKLVLQAQMFEKAKIMYEALKEASKTDPSLEEAVKELDALYEDALRQKEEDADSEGETPAE